MEKFENAMSKKQLTHLINFMEHHSLFARSQVMDLGMDGKQKFKEMWMSLTVKLNGLGHAKTTAEWKKVDLSFSGKYFVYFLIFLCSLLAVE